jgi:glutathione S-transferase
MKLYDYQLAPNPAGRQFVASDRYTIADIMALVTVNFASRINLAAPDGCSHLRRWHETGAPERRRQVARLLTNPAVQQALRNPSFHGLGLPRLYVPAHA